MRRNGRSIPDNKIKQIYTLFSKGLKTSEVSEILDIPEGSLSSYRNMFNALSSGGEISPELEQKYQTASRIAYEFFGITPPVRNETEESKNNEKSTNEKPEEEKYQKVDNTDYKVLREIEHFHDFFETFVYADYTKTNESLLLAFNAINSRLFNILESMKSIEKNSLETKNAILAIFNKL